MKAYAIVLTLVVITGIIYTVYHMQYMKKNCICNKKP